MKELKCLKSILMLNKIGDKCYGSTTGSNPVSVGSTPTSLANFGGNYYVCDKMHTK